MLFLPMAEAFQAQYEPLGSTCVGRESGQERGRGEEKVSAAVCVVVVLLCRCSEMGVVVWGVVG